jgi:hypothetical protein
VARLLVLGRLGCRHGLEAKLEAEAAEELGQRRNRWLASRTFDGIDNWTGNAGSTGEFTLRYASVSTSARDQAGDLTLVSPHLRH